MNDIAGELGLTAELGLTGTRIVYDLATMLDDMAAEAGLLDARPPAGRPGPRRR